MFSKTMLASLGFSLAAFALTGCAGGTSAVSTFTSATPASTPEASSGSQASHRSIIPSLSSELDGGEVRVSLTWKNESKEGDFTGVTETRVVVPAGAELVSEPAMCKHSLGNDVVCEFRGFLASGASTSRTLIFAISNDVAPGTTLKFSDAQNTTEAQVTVE